MVKLVSTHTTRLVCRGILATALALGLSGCAPAVRGVAKCIAAPMDCN